MANALGLRHHESDKLNRLATAGCSMPAGRTRAGSKVRRTIRQQTSGRSLCLIPMHGLHGGKTEERKGGGASKGTHIRLRDYFADARHTIALTLTPETESPTLEALAEALKLPERPLFIGRKNCLPSAPVFAGLIEADNIIDALLRAQAPIGDSESERKYRIWWPAGHLNKTCVTARTKPCLLPINETGKISDSCRGPACFNRTDNPSKTKGGRFMSKLLSTAQIWMVQVMAESPAHAGAGQNASSATQQNEQQLPRALRTFLRLFQKQAPKVFSLEDEHRTAAQWDTESGRLLPVLCLLKRG